MEPTFFPTPADWRNWLQKHHHQERELLVGFYKQDSGKPSISWPESVDAALCFGWIDGVRRRIDDVSYSIRFTPRKARSTWSVVNIKRIAELGSLGLMHPAGLKAFEARQGERSGIHSFEQGLIELEAVQEKEFRAHKTAWGYFQAQAPSYKRAALWWVISAKRLETKGKRLAALIDHSDRDRLLPHLTPSPKPNQKRPTEKQPTEKLK